MFNQNRVYEPPLPIARPPVGTSSFLVTCQRPVEVTTHWFGESLMCIGADSCPACKEAWQNRTVLYLSAIRTGGVKCLVELPLSVANRIDRFAHEDKLFAHILLTHKTAQRSEMTIEVKEEKLPAQLSEIEEHTIIDALARIFFLPRHHEFKDNGSWREALKERAYQKLRVALEKATTNVSK